MLEKPQPGENKLLNFAKSVFDEAERRLPTQGFRLNKTRHDMVHVFLSYLIENLHIFHLYKHLIRLYYRKCKEKLNRSSSA